MTKVLRWAGYSLASVIGLILVAAALLWIISSIKLNARTQAKREQLAQPTPQQLADAGRAGWTLGCFSCHGKDLHGGKIFDQPLVGTVWAPNLTMAAAHGTDQQLAQAIRQGIGVDGRSLFVMPAEAFQHLSDQEVAALIRMIRATRPGGSPTPPNSYGPLGRLGLVLGKFRTAPDLVAEYSIQEPYPAGPQFEAGRRLSMTTCSGCHGPDLAGKEVKPGETSPDLTIVGAYELAAFKKLLREGVPAGGQKLPMMGPTARSDLSHLTDAEIEAVYDYLRARAQRPDG
jgi:mono/diheme cytochrome c family protein